MNCDSTSVEMQHQCLFFSFLAMIFPSDSTYAAFTLWSTYPFYPVLAFVESLYFFVTPGHLMDCSYSYHHPTFSWAILWNLGSPQASPLSCFVDLKLGNLGIVLPESVQKCPQSRYCAIIALSRSPHFSQFLLLFVEQSIAGNSIWFLCA